MQSEKVQYQRRIAPINNWPILKCLRNVTRSLGNILKRLDVIAPFDGPGDMGR
jgi:hypothetical protein